MLELKDIVKEYYTQDETVRALKGVSLKFRKSEFVSILGPSGCGKTTMLNIIGGLDRYNSGDLIINGKSTKNYTDKEWDTYRNHSVGFVFQSYNLIPHQTVVENVELALTLSGIGKEERRRRAVAVLKEVGLENKLNSRPNQLSGGQMQRVAIARALINDPEILLADEPTGALDSKTSVQIMELLKEISKDRLIVMVTHNPDIAEKYSTRIITMLDGEIVEDPNPVTDDEDEKERQIASNEVRTNKGKKKTSMSFLTALSLSLKNLLTKKARTILVSFAGSIGIIGIALILSLSSGFQTYINNVQKDTLSNYPVTIEAETSDMSKLISSLGSSTEGKTEFPEDESINKDETLTNLVNTFINSTGKNDLKAFKSYLETNDYDKGKISSIQYVYNVAFQVHGTNVYGETTRLQSTMEKFVEIMSAVGMDLSMAEGLPISISFDAWSESIDNLTLVQSQYDLIGGNWANYDKADEVMLVLDSYNQVPDYILPALGLLDDNELLYPFVRAMAETSLRKSSDFPTDEALQEVAIDQMTLNMIKLIEVKTGISIKKIEPSTKKISFSDVLDKELYITLPHEYYQLSDGQSKATLKEGFEYNESRKVKIVGIVRLKEGATGGALNTNLIYTKALTDILINSIENSSVINAQKADSTIDIMTGLPFDVTTQNTYTSRLLELGDVNKDVPESINIYATTFEDKDYILSLINDYNEGKEDDEQIKYNDYLGTMMSGITDIINAISYILIGFVSVSLIVSSIMIGIITYISVLERIKEIGVLRALGASKKDVSRVFNAETLIIGFAAGILGIGVTILLNIPISLLINALAGISNVASLPWVGGVVLVCISMALTFIAGLIPAKIASKKDPVIALRTE